MNHDRGPIPHVAARRAAASLPDASTTEGRQGGFGAWLRGQGRLSTQGLLLLGLLIGLAWTSPPSAAQSLAESALAASPPEKPAIPAQNLLDIIRSGGILMWPLLLCSFLLAVFVMERTIALRRGRIIPGPFVKRFLQQLADGELDQEQAQTLCEQNKSPVADVFAGAVRKWGRPSVEVEQGVLDAGERSINHLRKYLRVFNGIATVAPLLGLLGTVLGMIECFNTIAIAQAMGKADLLAKGISEALLTTAAGLTIAIPALIAYMYFTSRVDRLIMDMDALGQEVVDSIAGDRSSRGKGKGKRSPSAA